MNGILILKLHQSKRLRNELRVSLGRVLGWTGSESEREEKGDEMSEIEGDRGREGAGDARRATEQGRLLICMPK